MNGPAFKIIPDSELVYGPRVKGFNTADFLRANYPNSFLASYSEDVDGYTRTGAEIIELVALNRTGHRHPRMGQDLAK